MTDSQINTQTTEQLRKAPPKLPATVADLLAGRTSELTKTLNDHVDEVHTILWEQEDYRRLFEAVYDEQATEGSLSADNFLAAIRIRSWASKNGKSYIQNQKLATIVKSLNVVLRRYHISRTERRNMIDGKIVTNGDSE